MLDLAFCVNVFKHGICMMKLKQDSEKGNCDALSETASVHYYDG